MANSNKTEDEQERLKNAIGGNIDLVNQRLDNMIGSSTATDTNISHQTDKIASNIYSSINNILSANQYISGLPDVGSLYDRLSNQSSDKTQETIDDLSTIFGDDSFINMILNAPDINRYIKVSDLQVDMILKYMTKLQEALTLKKDNVLSADNFNKEFLNVVNKGVTGDDAEIFATQAANLKKKYRLEEKFEAAYDAAATYGEQFIYLVPYHKALETLQKKRSQNQAKGINTNTIFESASIDDYVESNDDMNKLNISCNIHYNTSRCLNEVVESYKNAERIIHENAGTSLEEAFMEQVSLTEEKHQDDNAIKHMSNSGDPVGTTSFNKGSKKVKNVLPDDLEYDKLYDKVNDGFVSYDSKRASDDCKIDDIPGAIYRVLPRDSVIPIYIEDMCMGYYLIEIQSDINTDIDRARNNSLNPYPTVVSDTVTGSDQPTDINNMVRYIAANLASKIDNKFINANQDLKEEIYTVLKYNDKFSTLENSENMVNVTFIPPNDIFHFYFKLDPNTHRGISDLSKSIVPATFWILLSLTYTIGSVTRSQDHRVFYVKQNVEQNIAKTMMNVINQLKQGNMGLRQMQSMNSILNTIGKFNDYIIPVGASGDAPVTFDTISGQQVEPPTELMNKYEENAINGTEVPIEVVNASYQADYASRYTMQNVKFLRKMLNRQGVVEAAFSQLFSRIYNYEYGTNEKTITVKLPSPIFLTSINGLSMINNVRDYVNGVADIMYGQDGGDEKDKFITLMLRKELGSYIDLTVVDDTMEQAKLEIAAPTDKTGADTPEDEY